MITPPCPVFSIIFHINFTKNRALVFNRIWIPQVVKTYLFHCSLPFGCRFYLNFPRKHQLAPEQEIKNVSWWSFMIIMTSGTSCLPLVCSFLLWWVLTHSVIMFITEKSRLKTSAGYFLLNYVLNFSLKKNNVYLFDV